MEYDVVIVGAGPSGLCVAMELAAAGIRVKMVERRPLEVQSRAGTILPRVLELLDMRGLADTFIERARGIRDNPFFPVHIWAGLQPVHWKYLESRFGYRLILPQNVTEELLLQRVEELGVAIERDAMVTDVAQAPDHVRVTYTTPSGVQQIDAPWVIGADGGRSAVRTAINMPFRGHDATFTGIIADVILEFPWPDARRMRDNEKGWATSFPFSDTETITRFNIVHAKRRAAPQSEPVTIDEVRRCLCDIYEIDIEFERMRWASRFSDAMRIVDHFRDHRVLLVGEACRIHYPSSGVGMNFCIQDAFNLGWKLASVVKQQSQPELLDSYEAERMPVARALLESVKSQCALQFNFSSEGVAFKRMFETNMMPLPEVNARLARELNGLTFPYPSMPGSHPLTGERTPDVALLLKTGETRIGRELRHGEALLIDLTDQRTYDGLARDKLPVRCLSGVTAGAPASFDGLRSLLVRPDGYVGWASCDAPSLNAARKALDQWFVTP